jgi:hypothetical protein
LIEQARDVVDANAPVIEQVIAVQTALRDALGRIEAQGDCAYRIDEQMGKFRDFLVGLKGIEQELDVDPDELQRELRIGQWADTTMATILPDLYDLSDLKHRIADQSLRGKVASNVLYTQFQANSDVFATELKHEHPSEVDAVFLTLTSPDAEYQQALRALTDAVEARVAAAPQSCMKVFLAGGRLREMLRVMFDAMRKRATPLTAKGLDGLIGKMPPNRAAAARLTNGDHDLALREWNTEPGMVWVLAGNKHKMFHGTWAEVQDDPSRQTEKNELDTMIQDTGGKVHFVTFRPDTAVQTMAEELEPNLEVHSTLRFPDGTSKAITIQGLQGSLVNVLVDGEQPHEIDPHSPEFVRDYVAYMSPAFELVAQ